MFGDRVLSFIDGREDRIIRIAGVIGAICLVAIVIMVLAGSIDASTGKTFISLNVAPSNATIIIDGNEYANGVYELPAGEYSMTISKDGFNEKNTQFKVEGGRTNVYYGYILNKKEGFDYFRKSAVDIATLSHIDEQEAKDFMDRYNEQKAILDKLPVSKMINMNSDNMRISAATVSISDGSDNSKCNMAYCILVHSDGNALSAIKESVKDMIHDLGYDIADYEVIYEI